MRVASLRLHYSTPSRSYAAERPDSFNRSKNDCWGYVQEVSQRGIFALHHKQFVQDSGAEAFLLAIANENDRWSGHERFSSLLLIPGVSKALTFCIRLIGVIYR